MSQLYGRGREESYTPNHGFGENVYLVARASRPDETYEANKKTVVFNYYPCGKTVPQRCIAEVQTVSWEVTRHPVAVMESKKYHLSHVDGQSERDVEFVTKLQNAAIKATAGKLLGINLDQVQGHQVICEDGVCRIIQPSDCHGNSTISDGWSMQPTSIDENNHNKVAELFNKVSNWRGVNGHDLGRSSDTYDGWNNNSGDSYTGRNNNPQAPLSGRNYNDQGDNYIGSSALKEWPSTPQGYYQTTHYGGDTHKNPSSINGNNGNSDNMVSGNHGRLDGSYTRRNSPQLAPGAGSGYTGQTENLNGSNGWNKPLPTQQGYDQHTGYGSGIHKYPSSMKGNRSNSEDGGYGNHNRLDDSLTKKTNNPQALQAGSGYTSQAENFKGNIGLNKPLSTQQGYDQPVSYRGDTHRNPSSMSGNYSEGKGYGNSAKPKYNYNGRNNIPQAPQGGYDYNKTRVEYDGGKKGSNQGYGYGDGIDIRRKPISMINTNTKPEYEVYGNGYNSSSGTNIVGPAGTDPTVINSNEAKELYNGAFIK